MSAVRVVPARCEGCGAVLDGPAAVLAPVVTHLQQYGRLHRDIGPAGRLGTCADCRHPVP